MNDTTNQLYITTIFISIKLITTIFNNHLTSEEVNGKNTFHRRLIHKMLFVKRLQRVDQQVWTQDKDAWILDTKVYIRFKLEFQNVWGLV